ncbi:metal ABC transporter ATP-binding protein [Desulfothermobacter acidiphilus]|uniref:metal ABC transporter ATP-binding protein n=1 Tax=Desulfothermobacter acidiphilus TaxID=1938353 RepID=UPI003F8B2F8E
MERGIDFPAVSARGLTVAYSGRLALEEVAFALPTGVLAGLIGPNGAGKSTLMKAILELIPRVGGRIEFWGRSYREVRRRLAYVPQREEVDWDFPVTVWDVVLMGRYGHLGFGRWPRRRDKDRVKTALERVEMWHLRDRQIGELSGGQRQRVFLARALAQEADLYLLDEPFAGVDAATEQTVIEVLRQLRLGNKTVLVVHHDLQAVLEYFDWLILLNRQVIAFGPTEKVFTPANLAAAYEGRLLVIDCGAGGMTSSTVEMAKQDWGKVISQGSSAYELGDR